MSLTYYITDYGTEIFDNTDKLAILANEIAAFTELGEHNRVDVDMAWINLYDTEKYQYNEVEMYHSFFVKPNVIKNFVEMIRNSFEDLKNLNGLHFINVSNTIADEIVEALSGQGGGVHGVGTRA